jgi:hypothetical protein
MTARYLRISDAGAYTGLRTAALNRRVAASLLRKLYVGKTARFDVRDLDQMMMGDE